MTVDLDSIGESPVPQISEDLTGFVQRTRTEATELRLQADTLDDQVRRAQEALKALQR
jgi:hypothetical protein